MSDTVPISRSDEMHIYTDGASRGNPGPAACAYVCATKDGEEFHSASKYVGKTTNNRAEYEGVILALEDAISIHRGPMVLHSDSELVIRQLQGEYRVKKAELKPYHDRVREKEQRYNDLSYQFVPRENALIAEADRLCNAELDRQLGQQ